MNRRHSSNQEDTPGRDRERRRGANDSARSAGTKPGLLDRWKLSEGRWGVALVAAVFVAPVVMVPSDAVGQGIGLVLGMFAFLGLVAWAVWTCVVNRARWRCSWLDALAWGLLAWIGVSAWVMAGRGSPRLTLNLFWIWAALVASYWLARQFLRTAEDCRAVVALMFAVAVIEASLGMYQATYVRSRDRAIYQADPDSALRAAGIVAPVGSPLRAQFESRLQDTEPLGTFSLTNSLAGFLAPWLTLAIGVGLASFQARRSSSSSLAPHAPAARANWVHLAILASALMLVAICLLLTKSRSAYLATLGGIGLLSVIAARSRWKIPAWWLGAGVAGVGLLVVIATSFGLLDREVLTEARMSLGVRWEYWQSTWGMTLDHPWFGCGVGNFQNEYPSYKLPQASETVADPHNWFFEVAANAGWPAAAIVAAFFAMLVTRLVVRPLFGRSPLAAGPRDDQIGAVKVAVDRAGQGSASSARGWAEAGFGIGLFMAIVASVLAQFLPEAFLIVVAIPVGLGIVWMLRPWVGHGQLPAWAVGVALTVLLVNLLAAGSLTFAGVSGTIWLLAACGLRLRELESLESANSEGPEDPGISESRTVVPRWASFVGLAIAATLLIGCLMTAYRPVILSQTQLRLGDDFIQSGQSTAAQAAYEAAAAQDPWSHEPWQRLAAAHAQSVMRAPQSETAWNELELAVAESLKRNLRSYVLRRELGDLYLMLWRQTNDGRALVRAGELFAEVIRLFPNSSILHAHFAWWSYVAGDEVGARHEAEEALRLDELCPHQEQKLGNQRIIDGPSRFPEQPAVPEGETAEQVMRRLVAGK